MGVWKSVNGNKTRLTQLFTAPLSHILVIYLFDQTELKLFYTAFIDTGKLSEAALLDITDQSYNAMTANGDVKLREGLICLMK